MTQEKSSFNPWDLWERSMRASHETEVVKCWGRRAAEWLCRWILVWATEEAVLHKGLVQQVLFSEPFHNRDGSYGTRKMGKLGHLKENLICLHSQLHRHMGLSSALILVWPFEENNHTAQQLLYLAYDVLVHLKLRVRCRLEPLCVWAWKLL